MDTALQVIEGLRTELAYLTQEYGVKSIGLFGSYANNTAQDTSDIDLVIEFSRPIGFRFIELAEYLESVLGKPVDILTPAGIEGIRIPQVAQDIRESIEYV